MEMNVTDYHGTGFKEVVITHKENDPLVWYVDTYGKAKIEEPKKVFDELNRYWQWLGSEAQEIIFSCYQNIREAMSRLSEILIMEKVIKENVSRMYEQMPFESFQSWLLTRGPLYIPNEVRDELDPHIRSRLKQQTYLRPDYIELAGLALAIRPMLPIWGEYIQQRGRSSGTDHYREIEAVNLLYPTGFQDTKPWTKLESYAEIKTKEVPTNMETLLKGLGSADIPQWLFSLILVRRLTIIPLCDHESPKSIIAYIYKFTQSKLKPETRAGDSKVKNKEEDFQDIKDETNNASMLENYKMKQRIPDGDVTLFNVYTENMVEVAQKADPTFDLTLLEHTTRSLDVMSRVIISPHQIQLAQWTLYPVISPRAFWYMEKLPVVRMLAVAQALLWHWGFPEIATLVQVERVDSEDNEDAGTLMKPKQNTRISGKYIEELRKLYPHGKPQKSKDPNDRGSIVPAVAINALSSTLLKQDWRYHGPSLLLEQTQQPKGRSILTVAPTIKDQLTRLVLFIARRNQ